MIRAIALLALSASALFAQATASLEGEVVDPSSAPVAGVTVTLSNALTGFQQQVSTSADGKFAFSNIPFQTYQLRVEKAGFTPLARTLTLRTNVPQVVSLRLTVAEQVTRVDVSATDVAALVEPEVTGTRTELNATNIGKMPVPPSSRGLESVLVSFPGFAANANGAIHPRGAHNQMTFVVDGMPITDQLTGAFANAVDPSIVQTIELFTGNIPAEFGNKLSGVAVITTRSGTGTGRKFSGSTQVSAAQFDTLQQVTQFAGGTEKVGYFASFSALKTNRYLDQVSIDNLHNGGNSQRAFLRLDYQATPRDRLHFNLMSGRSSFQLANLRSQHENLQNQRQLLRDVSSSLGWLHTLDARTTIDATVSYRSAPAWFRSSAGDTPVRASQERRLTTINSAFRWNRVQGIHTLRVGGDWQHYPVSESFTFAITDPEFNRPGSEDFIPTLLPFDLSRGGRHFFFTGKNSGNLYSGFAQDSIRWKRLTATIGLRYDAYRFLVNAYQLQPRLGVSFHLRETKTVLRASYNRTFQTPPNENLLLSNSDQSSVLVPPDVRESLGGALIRIRPERQNVYEVGVQQALGSKLSLNASYYHKNSHDLQDNDNFFNTGIIFPTSLSRSRTNGAEGRFVLLPVGRISGTLSFTHFRTVVTPPFTGGLFLGSAAIDALSAGPFIIDHDQKLGVHGIVQYAVAKHVWASGSVRYDSGLVANPSDPTEVAADRDYSDLLPYVNLESSPARVRPRTVVDFAVGYDRYREGKRRWDAVFQISNLTNRTALYNFQSIFVGTRLVQPRTASVKLRFFF